MDGRTIKIEIPKIPIDVPIEDTTALRNDLDKLHDILTNGKGKGDRPKYDLSKKHHPTRSAYDIIGHRVIGSTKNTDFNRAILSHELAHSTGLLHNKYTKKPLTALYAGNNILPGSAVQLLGGDVGNAASALMGTTQLLEEGQANIRGALALRKLQGKLTKGNLAAYGLSMGSYLAENGIKNLALPKGIQYLIDKYNPGYAKKHKVLWDHIAG